MKTLLALILPVAAMAWLAAAPAPGTAPTTAPTSAPATAPTRGPKSVQGLTAVLIVNKDTYTLDPTQSGKDFRDRLNQVKSAQGDRGASSTGALPPPPAVDLVLRLTNASDAATTINIGGDDAQLQLKLEGPGAVTVANPVVMTMEFRIGTPVTIAPGKTYDVPITSLAFGTRGIAQYAYWTEPGDYTLTAELIYGTGQGKPQGRVESGPAKLKVEAPKPAKTATQ